MNGSEMNEDERLKLDRITHWDNVYKTKQTNEVSWFEAEPTTSLDLIESADPVGGRIIDVGGGASFLVDRLVAKDKWDVTVLDISSAAIEHARNRLGETGRRVKWICADIIETTELETYDLWHDRAVFHFLSSPPDRQAYLNRLDDSLAIGGYFIVAAFAPNGPEKCSGLQVCRYDVRGLQSLLGDRFTLWNNCEYSHVTPMGNTQQFTWAVFQKTQAKNGTVTGCCMSMT